MARVLTIENDENFRHTITKCVAQNGFEAMSAAHGAEGLAKALQTPPDLILCNLVLPGMDGVEVLAHLRKHEQLASVPVILINRQSEPSRVRQGMNLGADDCLSAPLDLAELIKTIKAHLARRQDEKRRQEQQIDRAVQVFYEIIHELRDPLFIVRGYLDQLTKGVDPPTRRQASQDAILGGVNQAVEHMQGIVSEAMSLVQLGMRQLPFNPAPFDLWEFCYQMVNDHVSRKRLRFDSPRGAYPIVADSVRLRGALENLLSNGLKYSEGTVLVSLQSAVGGYLIEVKDRGVGIPADEQAKVFEPFFRASNCTGKPGHGLGLSIVKSAIEQHGGRICFASSDLGGTAFSIQLPTSPPKIQENYPKTNSDSGSELDLESIQPRPAGSPTLVPRQSVPQEPGFRGSQAMEGAAAGLRMGGVAPRLLNRPDHSLKVFILDDDPMVTSVLRGFLARSDGVTIVGEARTLSGALRSVAKLAPNLVFLDIKLPDGSGFDLIPRLGKGICVVFVTSGEQYAVNAFDLAAVDYLLKPFSFERLQQALQRARQQLVASEELAPTAESKLERTVLVKTLTEKRLIRIGDIIRIMSYGEYSWVYWSNGKGALLRKSLKQWQPELPDPQFVRVHRRAIVNLAYMEHVEKLPGSRMQIHLRETAEPILVSLRLASTLNRKLKSFQA